MGRSGGWVGQWFWLVLYGRQRLCIECRKRLCNKCRKRLCNSRPLINELMNNKGGHRAARAAKKSLMLSHVSKCVHFPSIEFRERSVNTNDI